jgi:hypothetical protein
MRTLKSKPILFIVFALLSVAASGCGKSKNDGAAPLPGTPGYPGGLPQGGYPGGGVAGACMPIQGGVLQFQGSFLVDSANVVSSQQTGIGGQQIGGYPTQFQSFPACQPNQMPSSANPCAPSGQLVMSLTPVAYVSATQKIGVGTGILYLSQNMMATLSPYMGTCASVVGVNLGRAGNTLYGGSVTIAINGHQPMNLPF